MTVPIMTTASSVPPPTIRWDGDARTGRLQLLDQTLLPQEVRFVTCETLEQVWEAIRSLRVRGAPAIGVAAAYGVVVGLQKFFHATATTDFTATDFTAADFTAQRAAFDSQLNDIVAFLGTSRPTAVNLFWALDRMQQTAAAFPDVALPNASLLELLDRLLAEAETIEKEDRAMCAAIGQHGAALLEDGWGVLTHCNAGGLATAGDGTALSMIFAAVEQGKNINVFADETRPLLQGARLTAWEFQQRNIPVTVICDSMAAWVMRNRRVQAVVTGADRIAANGDAANKIGTYSLALLAEAHQIPFYIAAPSSTFDLSLKSGDEIPIEERGAEEITNGFGRRTVPDGVAVYNPAFDVTPAKYLTAIITERGLIQPVSTETVSKGIK